jgi:hypothetical protein
MKISGPGTKKNQGRRAEGRPAGLTPDLRLWFRLT